LYAGVLGLPVMRRQSNALGQRSIGLSLGEGTFLAVERADEGEPHRVHLSTRGTQALRANIAKPLLTAVTR
jgi:hypothetical protein